MYALIENNVVITYPLSLNVWRSENPNIALPANPTEAQLNEQGIYEVLPTAQPPYNAITQSCIEVNPHEENNTWFQTWEITQNTPEQIAYNENQAKAANKAQAESLLTATDWTTIPDVSDPALSDPYLTNAAEFAAYRSAIRKIAVNPPVVVDVWPVEPDEVWAYTNA